MTILLLLWLVLLTLWLAGATWVLLGQIDEARRQQERNAQQVKQGQRALRERLAERAKR